MKKRILTVFLALVLCMGLAIPAFAEEEGDLAYPAIGGKVYFYQGSLGDSTYYTASGADKTVTEINIPASIDGIPVDGIFSGSFSECSNLTAINVEPDSASLASVDGVLFNKDLTKLLCFPAGKDSTNYTLPSSVTEFEYSAFEGCSSLTKFEIPNTITEIVPRTFRSSGLTSVTIPDGVTALKNWAFAYCPNLTFAVIPSSVTAIDGSTFFGCTNLKDIYYAGTKDQWSTIKVDPSSLFLAGEDSRKFLENVTIHYSSSAPTVLPSSSTFTDVPAGEYYAEPVSWAVENNITNGTTDTTFSPEDTCTQVQILTFLWRAAKEPKSTAALPVDITGWNIDYADGALRWAAEKGMIDGTFDIYAKCTRATAASYIWQAFDKPEAGSGGFSDVPADADYAPAVAWAVEKGITNGTSATTFSPEEICTRGQIVTFLHRAYVPSARLTVN